MFDPCRHWRRQLSRHADGKLTHAEWGALEKHLSQCAQCQKAFEADAALQSVLGTHTGLLDEPEARAFDDKVVAALTGDLTGGLPHQGWWGHWRNRLEARCKALPFEFLSQIAVGALMAACITGICLMPALRSARSAMPHSEKGIERTVQSSANHNEPPVSLESLMTNPTPRAALLWSLPTTRHLERGHGEPELSRPAPVSIPTGPALPTKPRPQAEKHGALINSETLG